MFGLLNFIFFSASYAETPVDIKRLSQASKTIQSNYRKQTEQSTESIQKSFLSILKKNSARLVKYHKIQQLIDTDSSDFTDFAVEFIAPMVKLKMSTRNSGNRLKELRDLLRQVSTDQMAYSLINQYLELPASDTLLSVYTPKRVPFLSDQVTLKSNDARLSLSIDPKSTIVDFGGSGSANGIIDKGEWIVFSLTSI